MDYYENQLALWMDMACDLREFIEYTLKLSYAETREYQRIISKYTEGAD
jgi:hypothetical protein